MLEVIPQPGHGTPVKALKRQNAGGVKPVALAIHAPQMKKTKDADGRYGRVARRVRVATVALRRRSYSNGRRLLATTTLSTVQVARVAAFRTHRTFYRCFEQRSG
jgi:hypothetical protein